MDTTNVDVASLWVRFQGYIERGGYSKDYVQGKWFVTAWEGIASRLHRGAMTDAVLFALRDDLGSFWAGVIDDLVQGRVAYNVRGRSISPADACEVAVRFALRKGAIHALAGGITQGEWIAPDCMTAWYLEQPACKRFGWTKPEYPTLF